MPTTSWLFSFIDMAAFEFGVPSAQRIRDFDAMNCESARKRWDSKKGAVWGERCAHLDAM
jgi:hypothetical protein